jgi:hypothetical protein
LATDAGFIGLLLTTNWGWRGQVEVGAAGELGR